jgi:hypothetical protein
MNYIIPLNRYQTSFGSLDESISSDNAVRVLDAFVEKLDLKQLHRPARIRKSKRRTQPDSPGI